ncbi:class I SAM-dependent methyltransferase [Alginatibacterium sediminis]|uniref:Class I SAM-dependent methyltransferase n=1 Tax=Alginatibacterium sediminis TaxID=2164068 RepID=A0A420E703_9ALTE|nr:class I SAM-dependent methyltransferase [Alginatibacterium sediminis]RKF13724.1 class I SAM-dependent methyltransferase [Alginatibacterium sediminis]
MSLSENYYEQNADQFFDATVDVDMRSLYSKFLPELRSGATIVDAGCGSGRDTKAFSEAGFSCIAFDASPTLVAQAEIYVGNTIQHCSFLDFDSAVEVDAIWACASLLHVEYSELSRTFSHLSSFLKRGGIFYCSFKHGELTVERNGRRFTNLNHERLKEVIEPTKLQIKQDWITGDLREGRNAEQWLNAILVKT